MSWPKMPIKRCGESLELKLLSNDHDQDIDRLGQYTCCDELKLEFKECIICPWSAGDILCQSSGPHGK